MRKIVRAAFDQGQIPTISCINLATEPLGVAFPALVTALQEYADKHVAPVWGTPCKLVRSTAKKIPAKHWALVLFDDADAAGALGYHDLTPGGFPLGKVFVRTTKADGGQVSATAAHELAEMLVDPGIQLGAIGPDDVWYAYETADAVEDNSFNVRGIAMSNFVYPAWFEGFRKPKSTKFDHMGNCKKPFQILSGGYMPVFVDGEWTEIFGSKRAKKWFRKKHHPRTARRISMKPARRSKPRIR